MEDLVIHKSMKSFVDTTSIIRADKTIVIQNLLQEIASYLQKLMLPIIVLTLFITFYLKNKVKNIHLNFNSRWMFLFLISSDLSDFTML